VPPTVDAIRNRLSWHREHRFLGSRIRISHRRHPSEMQFENMASVTTRRNRVSRTTTVSNNLVLGQRRRRTASLALNVSDVSSGSQRVFLLPGRRLDNETTLICQRKDGRAACPNVDHR
jgi:hypothetical protein